MIILEPGALLELEALNPTFGDVARYLEHEDLESLTAGRYDHGGFRTVVVEAMQHTHAGARLERHEAAIDIHVPIVGEDVIGWSPARSVRDSMAPYDPDRDVEKYHDTPESWIRIPVGAACVCLPSDAHAPMGGDGFLKKIVVKVPVVTAGAGS